jgi:transcriptional regulator with XRE-family HTH domain
MTNILPIAANANTAKLIELGAQIRAQRKALRINAISAAEAAGMSRVTLHRIEHGEPSVTMGAYLAAMATLNMDFGLQKTPVIADSTREDHQGWMPAIIRLADYPQLKLLAWQVQGIDTLTPIEALSIYERNWRHVDIPALLPRELNLIEALRLGLGANNGNL